MFVPSVSRLSPWVIVTSESCQASYGMLLMGGVSGFVFYIAKDFDAKETIKLKFVGAGQGIGIGLPVDISVSTRDMPSRGLIYYGEQTPAKKGLAVPDFTGRCTIQVHSASLVAGVSATEIYFGSDAPFSKMARAVGVLDGTGGGTPGVSAMEYHGYIWRG